MMTGILGQLLRLAVWFALAVSTAAGGGFLLFAGNVERRTPQDIGKAETIVALTGGAQRLAAAVELLSEGRAGKLFITGVHPATSRVEMARTFPAIGQFLDCCVELDYEAENTLGNAVQTKRWMEQHHYHSLILVTSAYHMPRTLLEFQSAMPEARILPYPVVSETVLLNSWWADPVTFRVLAGEYAKFLFAWTRSALKLHLAVLSASDRFKA